MIAVDVTEGATLMVDMPALAMVTTRLHRQHLIPRAVLAANTAVRQWHASHPVSFTLAVLALYPHSMGLDVTDPASPFVVVRVDVGVPMALDELIKDYIRVGIATVAFNLDGDGRDAHVVMDRDQRYVDRWRDDDEPPREPPVPAFPVHTHGETASDTGPYYPDLAAVITHALAAQLIAQLDTPTRERVAHQDCRAVIAETFTSAPEEYGQWTQTQIRLETAYVRVLVPLQSDTHIMVWVELDVLGAALGDTQPSRLGSYVTWTLPDGTPYDDMYVLHNADLIE